MSVREYIDFASKQRDAMAIADTGSLFKALDAALAEHEEETGETLMMSDEEGMDKLYERLEDLYEGELDCDGPTEEDYVESIVAEAEHDMEVVKAQMAKMEYQPSA